VRGVVGDVSDPCPEGYISTGIIVRDSGMKVSVKPISIPVQYGSAELWEVEPESQDGIYRPEELSNSDLPEITPGAGVIISGRAPIWVHAFLVHHAHPASWVATYDPRLQGGVVVASHVPGIGLGAVVSF